MVLFKRKPVQFLPLAVVDDEDAEVWQIRQTGEIFSSYEDYLERMDFYKQRRFNDEITGHSGLTFSKPSILAGGKEVEEAFPEALKGPILRKVQFQVLSRLDSLVDMMYDDFKQDYFPGEEVTITSLDGKKSHACIRDKTAFGPRTLPDGTQSKPMTRYQVSVKDSTEEAMVTDENICRDRGVFTKAMLRSFIKRTVFREAWNGAPWLVKEEYATQYHIDTRIPAHLRYDTKLLERKMAQAQKRVSNSPAHQGDGSPISPGPVRLPELKPAPKGHKQKPQKGIKWPLNMALHGNNFGYMTPLDSQEMQQEPSPPPPPPPPPKYPIEDLQLDPREGVVRPPLRFMCRDPPDSQKGGDASSYDHIDMASVGPLLEVWDTLNVYCEVFKLDSFTFDDFVEAMTIASEEVPVQLIDEIHCAVLKILVDAESQGGKVRFALPEIEEDEEDEDEDEEGDEDLEDSQQQTPEPEIPPPARATRGSLAKQEAERLRAEAAAEEEEKERAELATKHKAERLLEDFDWLDALRKREFPDGGWERILVGLLFQLSKNERREQLCESLLLELVPPEDDPNQESVRVRYAEMDINSRVKILQLLCMLSTETQAFRSYMDECSETMTGYRKEKIEWQRQRKQAAEELRQLNEQRKILLPDNMPPSPPLNLDKTITEDLGPERDEESERTEAEEKANGRRKSNSKSIKLQKKRLEEERKEKEEQAAKLKQEEKKAPIQSKEFTKLLKEIHAKEAALNRCEEEIATIENDLREADCPRTRVLGKDRFWNRYYWFERNGMPYGGLPTSSTASAGYANGCIWVQGPDDLEREGYIEVEGDLQKEYAARFNMTIPERKRLEEGETMVYTANQWGYISEPGHVDELIKWLDSRGFNEMKLRKELVGFREKIIAHMECRQKYLSANDEEEKRERERRDEAIASKRTSSRIKDKTPEPPSYRCLQWENTMVLEADDMGHLHSEPPPPPKVKKVAAKKREAAEAAAAGPPAKTRRR